MSQTTTRYASIQHLMLALCRHIGRRTASLRWQPLCNQMPLCAVLAATLISVSGCTSEEDMSKYGLAIQTSSPCPNIKRPASLPTPNWPKGWTGGAATEAYPPVWIDFDADKRCDYIEFWEMDDGGARPTVYMVPYHNTDKGFRLADDVPTLFVFQSLAQLEAAYYPTTGGAPYLIFSDQWALTRLTVFRWDAQKEYLEVYVIYEPLEKEAKRVLDFHQKMIKEAQKKKAQ